MKIELLYKKSQLLSYKFPSGHAGAWSLTSRFPVRLIAAVPTQPYAYQVRQHQVQDGKLHDHLMVKGQTFHSYQGPILNRRFFFFFLQNNSYPKKRA